MRAPVDVFGDGSDAPALLTASAVSDAEIDARPGVAVVAESEGSREELARQSLLVA